MINFLDKYEFNLKSCLNLQVFNELVFSLGKHEKWPGFRD
jgi:hypothetical protein